MKVLSDIYIEEAPLCFFDCETTGLDPFHGDRICEIALLRVEKGKVIKSFETLINPERGISLGAYFVNGISAEMLEGKPRFIEIVPEILEGLGSAAVVGHNVSFDLNFLSEEFRRLGMIPLNVAALDTVRLAKRKFSLRSCALVEVAHSLGLSVPRLEAPEPGARLHRAMTDVLLLRDVFERMTAQLRQREGIVRLNELLKIAGL
ncbi:MAG: 3'-5' exonuclease [Elusimicrobiota bacterium]